MTDVERLSQLFRGLERAYGIYRLAPTEGDDRVETEKIEGSAITRREPVTPILWQEHVAGRQGLGVVPIRDDDTVFFGAIDIDVYPIDIPAIASRVAAFPVICCRTKSGGMHVYAFFKEAISANLVIKKLRELAVYLGYGTCEVFPKQSHVISERGDVGNWINVPYFGGDDTTRYAVTDSGVALSLSEFLDTAEHQRIGASEWKALAFTEGLKVSDPKADLLRGIPPCLRHLCTQGFAEGTRNDGLFNVGVYVRLRYGDDWETKLDEYNQTFMDPALRSSEVAALVKSLVEKSYTYTCNKPPIQAYCNRDLCLKQTYGIGKAGGTSLDLQLASLTKLQSDPPLYFLDVEGRRVKIDNIDDLIEPRRFRRLMAERLDKVPTMPKAAAWDKQVNELLANVVLVESTADSGEDGLIWDSTLRFCQSFGQSVSRDEILMGKPWSNPEDGQTYFKLSSLATYLRRQQIPGLRQQKIAGVIHEHGARAVKTTVKRQYLHLWVIKTPEADEPTSITTNREVF